MTDRLFTRRRLTTALLVWVVLMSIYSVTYSAFTESGDSLQYFDAASSLVRWGDMRLDESHWFGPYLYIPTTNASSTYYLTDPDRLSVIAGAGLYALGDLLPDVGYAHLVWLFGVIVTALTGTLVYLTVVGRGFDDRTGVIVALLYGIGTNAWAYSKTFFPDMFVAFWLILALLAIGQWRRGGYRLNLWPVIGLLALGGAILTKTSAVIALPAFIIWLMPHRLSLPRRLDWLIPLAIGGIALIVYAEPIYQALLDLSPQITARLSDRGGLYAREALHSYLFSIGGSVWGTSPVLVLGFVGGVWLIRNGQRQLVWTAFILLMAYAVGHAVLTGQHWFGGLSWPPRFLLPVLPVGMILAAPVIDSTRKRRALWLIIAPLSLYAVWVQFNAVALPWLRYPDILPPEANGLISWAGGMNDPRFLRWVLLPESWASLGFDFAWYRSGLSWWPLIFAGVTVSALVGLSRRGRLRGLIAIGALGLWCGAMFVGLRGLYTNDPLFLSNKTALFQALDVLRDTARAGDIVVLNDSQYHRWLMNYSDLPDVQVVVLPTQPGEAPGPNQPPQVESDHAIDLLTPATPLHLYRMAQTHDRLWLLANNSQFIPFAVRPVERFLAETYHFHREIALPANDPTVRLLEFSTVPAPDRNSFISAENATDFRFGDSIQLTGFTLAFGQDLHAGDVLPVALTWETDAPLTVDYGVSWFVVDEAGAVIAQGNGGRDVQPNAGFSPTSGWPVNQMIWDNRAVQIPTGTPAGDYRLWVRVYGFDDSGQPTPLTVTGGDVAEDATVAVLPVVIRVR